MEQTIARFLAVSAAALALTVAAQAQAGSPGSHPAAVQAARGSLPYDYTTKFYLHPARPDLLAHAPRPGAEHPAVLVARTWLDRGIDPNHFIPAHPAQSAFAGPESGLVPPALTLLGSRPDAEEMVSQSGSYQATRDTPRRLVLGSSVSLIA